MFIQLSEQVTRRHTDNGLTMSIIVKQHKRNTLVKNIYKITLSFLREGLVRTIVWVDTITETVKEGYSDN